MFKAIIFDFGGVLVRTANHESRQKLDKRLDLREGGSEQLVFESEISRRAQLGQISTEELWSWIADQHSLSSDELTQFQNDFWAGDFLDSSLIQFISSLRPKYKTAILSNAFDNLRAVLADPLAIADAFDVIVVSAEEKVMKPSAEIYQIVLERLGVDASEAIFFDDFEHNVAGARAAGIEAIRFDNSTDVRAELARRGIEPDADNVPAGSVTRENGSANMHSRISKQYLIRPATVQDSEPLAALINKAHLAMMGQKRTNSERMGQRLSRPRFDLNHSTRVVLSRDGDFLGYAAVHDTDTPPVSIYIENTLDPE